jgi:hypothetical protein
MSMPLSRVAILGLGSVVGAATLAPAASAGTISYTGFVVTGDSITINTPHSTSGVAGEIHLITTSGSVDAWCIDVYDVLQGAGVYNIGPSSSAAGSLGEIGALAEHGDFLAANPGSYSADDVATAIQVAIWTVEYGPSFGYNPLGSPVDAAPPNPDGLVGYYLSQVGAGNPWGLDTDFQVLSSTDSQTGLSNQTSIAAVPEASIWSMMLAGFAGLAIAGYRASRRAAVPVGG